MTKAVKKTRGRPPKPEDERRGSNITFRTPGGLRERLEKAATNSGRSISEEVVHRLERSFHAFQIVRDEIFGSGAEYGLTTAIFASLRPAGIRNGDDWTRDPDAYREALIAVLDTMITHAPNSDKLTGQDIMLLLDSLKSRMASRLLNRGKFQ